MSSAHCGRIDYTFEEVENHRGGCATVVSGRAKMVYRVPSRMSRRRKGCRLERWRWSQVTCQ